MQLDPDELTLIRQALNQIILTDQGRVARGSVLGRRLSRARALAARIRGELAARDGQAEQPGIMPT